VEPAQTDVITAYNDDQKVSYKHNLVTIQHQCRQSSMIYGSKPTSTGWISAQMSEGPQQGRILAGGSRELCQRADMMERQLHPLIRFMMNKQRRWSNWLADTMLLPDFHAGVQP